MHFLFQGAKKKGGREELLVIELRVEAPRIVDKSEKFDRDEMAIN